jgi:3-oxoacyl-[acyl-carrier protein] reductase
MSISTKQQSNRVAFVTGSAKRVGKEIILSLSEAGYDVWIHYKSSEREAIELASMICANGRIAHCVQGDIRDRKAVETIMSTIKEKSGHLDVLVNNIGEYKCGPLLEYAVDDFESTIQSNLVGSYYAIHYSLPLLRSGGSIINLGYSGVASLVAHPHNAAYSISKLGLLSLTKSYAHVLGPTGVRVNMISPGQLENSIDLPVDFEEHVPLRRVGTVQDISKTLLFIISEEASYITGQNIEVSGGYMMKLED